MLSLVTLGLGLPEPQLEWSGDAACPGAELELSRAIVDYVHPEASELVAVAGRVRIVDAGPAGLRLELELRSDAGRESHVLTAIDCAGLLEQASVLIAGAIDPFAYAWPGPPRSRELAAEGPDQVVVQRPRAPELESAPEPAGPGNTPPELRRDQPPPLELGPLELAEPTRDRPRAPISGALSVGATGFVGVFPGPAGGVELEGALERGRLRWHTQVGGWFGGRFRSSLAEVGADLWALAFASALCGVPGQRRVRVPLCATAGLGFMSANAVGTVEPRRNTQPWAWAGAEARVLVLAREDFAVGLGLGAMAALIRPAWAIESPGVRFRVPPAMGVLRLTFEARELRRRKKSAALAIKSP